MSPLKPDNGKNKPKVWYSEGLRFECGRCGDCCRGEPGVVWVTRTEREAIAAFLDKPLAEFDREFVRLAAFGRSLKEHPNGDCYMWRDGVGCSIYPVRPRQCRTFPFWNVYLGSPEDWSRAARRCPGVNHGKLHTAAEIERIRDESGGI
ncbi:MAG TPA: YkgJ family cysteine cluster protein [Candidatus Brocadiia bacterium]|nr:YkgJ family cysteine cluster protein [Candidatus Brocadiia bacterium]